MATCGGNSVEAAVLGAAKQIEKALDDEIADLETMGEDDMEAIRKRRLSEMKKKAEMEALWRRRGHGTVTRIDEKDFFTHSKDAERFVLLVTRPGTSRFSQDMEEHLGRIAERHIETFFAVLNAEKSPFLCQKFNLVVMPSIMLVKNHAVHKILHGLDAFTEDGKLDTVVIESRLFDSGLVTHHDIADDN